MELKLNRKHFINQYPPFNLITTTNVEDMYKKQDLLLYAHIPFCPDKCGYCYYKSTDSTSRELIEKYLVGLKKEIDMFSKQPDLKNRQIKSLYLGGGTPTILTDEQYKELIEFIFERFEFRKGFEFCSEARPHPATLDQNKLQLMKSLGVNRLSMGMQSLNDEILRLNKREGSVELYHNVLTNARNAGFDYINVDIMSGMLGENWKNWNEVMDLLIKWSPESIAIYKMELFFNTQLYRDLAKAETSKKSYLSDEEEIEYITHAHKRLVEDGGYEVANCLHLVKDGRFRDIHYTSLWNGTDMKGFGVSAHSCYNGFIHQNSSNIKEYLGCIESGQLPVKRAYKLSIKDRISEAMVYGLKNLSIKRSDFINRFGFEFIDFYQETIDKLVNMDILELNERELKIKPEYYIFADDICREFFLDEYKSMMLAQADR